MLPVYGTERIHQLAEPPKRGTIFLLSSQPIDPGRHVIFLQIKRMHVAQISLRFMAV